MQVFTVCAKQKKLYLYYGMLEICSKQSLLCWSVGNQASLCDNHMNLIYRIDNAFSKRFHGWCSHLAGGIIISATATDNEMFDILFRVQGSSLAETDRPRNLIGGLIGKMLWFDNGKISWVRYCLKLCCSETDKLISKRLCVENKAKLSQLENVNKQYLGGVVLSFQLRELRFVLYR